MATKPYSQGDLDGLCGLYAAVNAFRHALDWSQHHHSDEDLFQVVAKAVPKAEYPEVLWEGMTIDRLLRVCRKARGYLASDWDCEVRIDRPFLGVEYANLQSYLDDLKPLLEPGRSCAILQVAWAKSEGGHAHWTALDRITKDDLYLIDSGKMRRMSRQNLRTRGERGRRICTEETVIVTRVRG